MELAAVQKKHILFREEYAAATGLPRTLRENNLFYLKNWSFNSAPLFNHSVTSKINPSRLNSTIKSSYLVSDHGRVVQSAIKQTQG